MPKLSVIVPIYKVENYLQQCVDSIISQNFRDLEIILVDDGSPDNCPQICDEYMNKDDRVRVIHKANGGLVSARKAGLEIATGEYITYVDGDDWIAPDMYEHMLYTINKTSCDIVMDGFLLDYGDRFIPMSNNIAAGIYSTESEKSYLYRHMLYSGEFYKPGIYPNVWNKLFRRKLIYPIQMSVPSNISMGEDVAVTYLCLLQAKSIVVTDACKYYYRSNPNAMTKKYDKEMFQKMGNLVTYLMETLYIPDYQLDWQMEKYFTYLLSYGAKKELSIVNRINRNTNYSRIREFITLIGYSFEKSFNKDEYYQLSGFEKRFLKYLSDGNYIGAELFNFLFNFFNKIRNLNQKYLGAKH